MTAHIGRKSTVLLLIVDFREKKKKKEQRHTSLSTSVELRKKNGHLELYSSKMVDLSLNG